MARLLITGASGLLGANLVLGALAAGHEVVAVSRRHGVRHPMVDAVRADLSSPAEARRILDDRKPDWVIHCAAAADVEACELEPAMAFRLNRDMAGQVAMAARSVGARLAHVSTDAVFDGERGDYTEEDLPRPINVYGESKLEGERVVQHEHPKALVVRTNFYGWNALPKLGLAEWFLSRLRAGQETPGFVDVWFSPILASHLGDILLRLLANGRSGIWHLGGSDCLRKYDFGVQIASTFGENPGLIRPVEVSALRFHARRGRRLCLRSIRIGSSESIRLPSVSEGLSRWKREEENGTLEGLRALVAPDGWSGTGDA